MKLSKVKQQKISALFARLSTYAQYKGESWRMAQNIDRGDHERRAERDKHMSDWAQWYDREQQVKHELFALLGISET